MSARDISGPGNADVFLGCPYREEPDFTLPPLLVPAAVARRMRGRLAPRRGGRVDLRRDRGA